MSQLCSPTQTPTDAAHYLLLPHPGCAHSPRGFRPPARTRPPRRISAALCHELSSLLRTCRGFACILSPELAKLGVTAADRGTGRSLLHWAASHGRTSLVQILLAHGAAVDTTDRRGCTALHSAVLRGHTSTVSMLLEQGADVQLRNAAITGHTGIPEALVDHGAGMSVRSGAVYGRSPFHYAAMLGHVAVAELFMQRFADLDARDSLRSTLRRRRRPRAMRGW